jgi:hypothetical protein
MDENEGQEGRGGIEEEETKEEQKKKKSKENLSLVQL